MNRILCSLLCAVALAAFVGCTKTEPGKTDDYGHSHADDDGHNHDDDKSATPNPDGGHGSHGEAVELGTATIADWSVRAARDVGELSAGGEAAIDVWLTNGTSKIVAVRFWIGTEDASGSIKARADIENPAEPNHWHTHAELPSPMPADAKLWVEIESEGGEKSVGSFELKMS